MYGYKFIKGICLFVNKRFNVRCLSNTTASNHNIKVSFDENVGIINFGEGEKKLTDELILQYHSALDQVESNSSCNSLVSTAEGKFFSYGLNMDFLVKHDCDSGERKRYFKDFRDLFQRVLTFPMPTVAALNGHAFAGGALFAWTHDFRVMRNDRGWISLNEIFINERFTHFLFELLRNKLPVGQAQYQAIVLGKRFTAPEAKEFGLVELITDKSTLVSESVNLMKTIVKDKNYDRNRMKVMKNDLYYNVIQASDNYYKIH